MGEFDDEIIKRGLKLINESFGFGRKGTHKKKCEICGYIFDEPNDLNVLAVCGPSQCPFCVNIDKLQNFINEYELGIMDFVDRKEKMIQSHQFNFGYKVENQANEIKRHGSELPFLWRQLTVDIDGNLEILESLYDEKHSFWNDGGNLKYYVNNSTLYFIVMRLVELVKKCNSVLNVIENNKKSLLAQKIHFVAVDKKQEVICDEIVPIIDLDKTILFVKEIFKDLKPICNDLKDFRDKVIAHMDFNASDDFLRSLSIINMKRVQNALKNICAIYFLILALQLYNPGFEMHGIDLDRMEYISKQFHSKK
jgi:hypothetical protein